MTTVYIIIGIAILIAAFIYFRSNSTGVASFGNVSVGDLKKLMKNKNTQLVDVRTKNEIRQGKIGKPLEIELGATMKEKLSKLNKEKKYIVYCRSGRRSAVASKIMVGMGFNDVNNLVGGFNAWTQK